MRQTRKEAVESLLQRLQRGPSLSNIGQRDKQPADYERDVRGWLATWVQPLCEQLIKEMRDKESKS